METISVSEFGESLEGKKLEFGEKIDLDKAKKITSGQK